MSRRGTSGEAVQSFRWQTSALPPADDDVFSLHSLWLCALAEICLSPRLYFDPQPLVSLLAVISDGLSAPGRGCEEKHFPKDKINTRKP